MVQKIFPCKSMHVSVLPSSMLLQLHSHNRKSALKMSGGSTEEDVCKTGHILEATRDPEGVQTTHT